MSDNTTIQWTHQPGFTGETWNPIIALHKETGARGWHCEHASRGCDNCYAEHQNKQGIRMGTKEAYTRAARERVTTELHGPTLKKPLSWRKPRCVFVCSMTDLFGEWVTDDMLDRVFAVMAMSPQHRYLVLTKRPERMRKYLTEKSSCLPNVWLGVTAENQATAEERIPILLDCPAAVRFVSYEPGIGLVDFHFGDSDGFPTDSEPLRERHELIDWIIVGGESGRGAREFNITWAASVIKQCQEAGVPVFVKQLGAKPVDPFTGRLLTGLGGHGDYFDKWPERLKVRQFPQVAA